MKINNNLGTVFGAAIFILYGLLAKKPPFLFLGIVFIIILIAQYFRRGK